MKKLICTTLAWMATLAASAAFHVSGLKVEYTDTPLGIDVPHPRFSWQMSADGRGAAQTAWQIRVTDAGGREVWDSGRTPGGEALGVRYAGSSLQPSTRYRWTLSVWGTDGTQTATSSWFETGLMGTDDRAAVWAGAKWIGGDDSNALTFQSQYLPVFRLSFSVSLDNKTHSTRAGFIYGANDLRLLDGNRNILGVANERNGSYVMVVLNTAGLDRADSAAVEVYRVGYTTTDRADVPLQRFKLSPAVVGAANRYAAHAFELSSMHGTTRIFLDGGEKPVAELNLNPMGVGGDYISFPNVGDLGYDVPAGQKATFSGVQVLNYRLPRHTLAAVDGPVTLTGSRRIFTPRETGAPMLRTVFDGGSRQVTRARIYVTARGIYELFLNGQRVGNDYLNPGLTQYNKTQFYQTYDVTPLIRQGANALGAQLNEGWWSGAISFSGDNWNFFGDKQSLLAKLVIDYADGTVRTIVTDPATWQFCNEGPVRLGSLFQGEIYDATREAAVEGWTTAGYDAALWQPAREVPLEGTISHETLPGFFAWPCPDDYSAFRLTAQVGRPVRLYRTLTARQADEVRPGVFVYDMGQNMAGVPRITFHGLKPGTQVILRYAEVRYPDLPEYKGNVGMVMMENQRGAMEQDIYIAKGGTETFEPRATYHGYRYVEITGIPSAVPVADVEGLVLSSIDTLSAEYETGDAALNRFFENTRWSTLANVFSIPTDCPQRNERMGWSGDLSVFSPAMSYMFNGAGFLRRHLQALRDTQEPDGAYAAVAPVGGGFGGPLWSSVGITMPWQSYLQYGDVEALREHYASMQKYTDLMLQKYIDPTDHYYVGTGGMADLGDWLGFEVAKNDNSLIFDSYLVHELHIMAGVARALGKTADADRYDRARRTRIDFINRHYFDPATAKTVGTGFGEEKRSPFGMMYGPKRKGVSIDTQTSYAVPLAFGIVADSLREKFVANLLNTVSRRSVGDDGVTYPEYSLMTGFIGTAWISLALSEAGHSDAAYRMLLNKQFPSWLYPVEQGATTIWERLNSYTKDKGFGGNNSMNSFNHYAFGSVANWLMQRSLGIARDEASPGFKHFVLRPEPDTTGGLTFASGHYDSMYGRIESCWKQDATGITYRFTVPANTTATLLLPAARPALITESGLKLKKAAGVSVGALVQGKQQLELQSGTYEFHVARAPMKR